MRRHMPRFQEEVGPVSHIHIYASDSCHPQNLEHNFTIVDALIELAKKKNITPAQLSIAWVSSLGAHVIPLPGSSYVPISTTCPVTLRS